MKYLTLTLMWVAWCVVHSGMISAAVTRHFKHRLGDGFRFYRLSYNLIALFTLLPVYAYGRSIQGPVVFRWDGGLIVVQVFLLASALFLFVTGARHYDMRHFIGLRQIVTGSTHVTLTESGGLDTGGILGVTRHPWYLAAMLFLWSAGRSVDLQALIMNIVLTAYLVVGTVLEERKLVAEHGEAYRSYQREVDMLIPISFLRKMIRGS